MLSFCLAVEYINGIFGSPMQSWPEDQPAIEEHVKIALWFQRTSKDYKQGLFMREYQNKYTLRIP